MNGRRLQILFMLVMLFTPLFAGQDRQAPNQQVVGTVSSWNESARVFTVTDDSGKRWDLSWTEATAILSRPSVGDRIKVSYAVDEAGKVQALRIGKAVKLSHR